MASCCIGHAARTLLPVRQIALLGDQRTDMLAWKQGSNVRPATSGGTGAKSSIGPQLDHRNVLRSGVATSSRTQAVRAGPTRTVRASPLSIAEFHAESEGVGTVVKGRADI